MIMEKFPYQQIPLRCIKTGPSCCGKSVILPNLFSKIFNGIEKINIYSPSLHQNLYQKLINCFSKYIPITIIPNNLNEKGIDLVIDEDS